MNTPGHILVVRLSAVGDIVLATPVAARLRRSFPRARLTWLVDRGYRQLLEGNPHLDEVVEFDYGGRHRGPGGIAALADRLGTVDLLVDLQNKVRTVLLAAQLQPARRLRLVKRPGFGWLRAVIGRDAILRAPHQVLRNLRVLDELDGAGSPADPRLVVDERFRDQAEAVIGRPDGMPVGLVLGTRHPTKQWPARHWARLARDCRQHGAWPVLLGGAEDASLIEAIGRQLGQAPVASLAGGSLGLLAAVLARLRAVVAVDSGPAHMAAALGIPVVSLFGPTSPERWAPWGTGHRVVRLELPCTPCSNHGSSHCPLGTHECMQQLVPELVWQQLEEVLAHAA